MGILTNIFNTLIILTSIFLICLVLIQRGKGGGLAGAFGGVGGSSAFGTKAGDTFTRITVITAAVWMLMAMLLVVMTGRQNASTWANEPASAISKDWAHPAARGRPGPQRSAARLRPQVRPPAQPPPPRPPQTPARRRRFRRVRVFP